MLDTTNKLVYKGYRADVRYDSEDGLYVGRVIDVDDVLGFHGSSEDELMERFHLCIDDYIDICKRYGRIADKDMQ